MKKGHIRSNYTWKKNYLAERGFLEFLSADTDSPKPFCSRASGSMYNGAFPWKRPQEIFTPVPQHTCKSYTNYR